MVNFCCVNGCSNRSNRETSHRFYRIPGIILHKSSEEKELSLRRRQEWMRQLGWKVETPIKSWHRVCSDHFVSGKPADLYLENDPDWAPTRCIRRGRKTKTKIALQKKREAAASLLRLATQLKTEEVVVEIPIDRVTTLVKTEEEGIEIPVQGLTTHFKTEKVMDEISIQSQASQHMTEKEVGHIVVPCMSSTSMQTEYTMNDIGSLESEVNRLLAENLELQRILVQNGIHYQNPNKNIVVLVRRNQPVEVLKM